MFNPPANLNDFEGHPQLRAAFDAIWNKPLDNNGDYCGSYVDSVVRDFPNYVDPRVTPPQGQAVKIPWNGFPRLMSRHFKDETGGVAAREAAEAAADVLTPVVYWARLVQQPNGSVRTVVRNLLLKDLPAYPPLVQQLARPLREVMPDGTVGAEVLHVRRQQDEYLEWHAERDTNGVLTALAFTAEPPDYWEALAEVSKDLVWERYKAILKRTDIPEEDLFPPHDRAAFGLDLQGNQRWLALGTARQYDPLNPWTTTRGIVHLTHAANTLGAEIFLAGEASLNWSTPAIPNIPPEIARIACGQYGGVNRSSDPLIGNGVGDAIAAGARVTLTDPIGLYISDANLSSLTGPNGEPVGLAARHVTRGEDDAFNPRIVRLEVRLPAGAPFKLGECQFDGRQLKRGGQIARQTTMHIFANTYPGSAVPGSQPCAGRLCTHPTRTETFSIGDVARVCPDANSPSWLPQTPLVADTGGPSAPAADSEPSARATVMKAGAVSVRRAKRAIQLTDDEPADDRRK